MAPLYTPLSTPIPPNPSPSPLPATHPLPKQANRPWTVHLCRGNVGK